MSFINLAPIGEDGSIQASPDAPTNLWPRLAGYAYDADGLLAVSDSEPAAGEPYLNGIRISPEGAVYIWSVENDGAPPEVQYARGLPITASGRLIVTSELPPVRWVAGWPIANNEWVCMNGGDIPPPTVLISEIYIIGGGEGQGPIIGQLRYGASGALVDTGYSSEAAFLTDNPAVTLAALEGVAPPASNAIVTSNTTVVHNFVDFIPYTGDQIGDVYVYDDAWFPPYAALAVPFAADQSLRITFTPPVAAVGMLFNAGAGNQVQFYDGVTLLHTQVVGLGGSWGAFGGFAVGGGSPPVGDFYQQEGNTDVYIQESADAYIQE